MPEYLAPGVYVEEVSFRAKSIEGVSTSTTGFVGTSAAGPRDAAVPVRSFADFERTFGGLDPGSDLGYAVQLLATAAARLAVLALAALLFAGVGLRRLWRA